MYSCGGLIHNIGTKRYHKKHFNVCMIFLVLLLTFTDMSRSRILQYYVQRNNAHTFTIIFIFQNLKVKCPLNVLRLILPMAWKFIQKSGQQSKDLI